MNEIERKMNTMLCGVLCCCGCGYGKFYRSSTLNLPFVPLWLTLLIALRCLFIVLVTKLLLK